MARVNNGRPDSRGSDAPDATGGRTTRARSTRSQSREPSELPDVTDLVQRKGGRKGKAVIPAPPELTTVDEDPSIEEGLAAEEASPVVDETAANMQRPRRLSNATQQTSFTTFSKEERDDMDAETMIYRLPKLAAAADEVFEFVPANPLRRRTTLEEVRTTGTKQHKQFMLRADELDDQRRRFGSTKYIQPSTVVRKFCGVERIEDVPTDAWRTASVLYKANLATMLRTVLISMSDELPVSLEAYHDFEDLAANFGHAVAGRKFNEHAFDTCLAMLRQLCMQRVALHREDPNFDAANSIQQYFFTGEEGALTFRHQTALHMESLPLELLNDLDNRVQNTASELMDTFKGRDTVTALQDLRSRYPWSQFVEGIGAYYFASIAELNNEIETAGGLKRLIARLSEKVEVRANDDRDQVLRDSLQHPDGTSRPSYGTSGAISKMKARMKKTNNAKQLEASAAAALAAAPSTAPVAQMTDPALTEQAPPVDDGWQPMPNDDDDVPATEPPQRANRAFLAALDNIQADLRPSANKSKGKGRSLLDRQDGAQRITWTDSQSQIGDDQRTTGFQYPSSLPQPQQQGPYYNNSQKRTHDALDDDEPDEFEPTQDGGFEVDTRDMAAADQRRRQAPQPIQHRREAASSSAPALNAGAMEAARPHKIPRQSTGERRNPGSTIPNRIEEPHEDANDGTPPASRLDEARYYARISSVMTAKQRQRTRTPWSEDEENALLALITDDNLCREGISYSRLKSEDSGRVDEQGPQLLRRSAEDMRFKARNMKLMFLKAQQLALPKNFEHINLDKKAIDKLREMGIAYYQQPVRMVDRGVAGSDV